MTPDNDIHQAATHLTDEAFSDLLAGTADDSISPRADAATPELLALRQAIAEYRVKSLTWAERKSATQPSLAPRAKANAWAAVPQWSLATVAVVAVAAGVVHFAGYGADDAAPASPAISASSSAPTARPDDIAADNQLLGSIDQALQYNAIRPDADFKPHAARATARASHSQVTD